MTLSIRSCRTAVTRPAVQPKARPHQPTLPATPTWEELLGRR